MWASFLLRLLLLLCLALHAEEPEPLTIGETE